MNTSGLRRWWALGALALAVLVVALDTTVLNIALPTLATDLHASTSQLQWFADAYNLVFAAALLPAGLLGDRFGRKKLLLAGLAMFGIASFGCAYAGSAGELIAARAVLGLGGVLVFPLSMAVLPVLFPPEERAKALGVWVAATALGFPIGPIVGGWLLNSFWWGSVFLLNVPVVALALLATALLVPESRSAARPGLDHLGVLTSSAGLVGVTYGTIEAGERGWDSPRALLTLAAGALLLAAFSAWQRHLTRRVDGRPLIDLRLFSSASFMWGSLLATLVSFSMFGLLFAVPQFFQGVDGTDAFGSGVRLLPIVAGLLVGAQAGGRLASRLGAKAVVALGFGLLAAALAMGATTSVGSGYAFTGTWIALVGLGLGFALPTAMDAAIGELSAERSGVGSALIMAMRQVGGTVGVAILGSLLNAGYRAQLELGLERDGVPAPAAAAARDSVSAGVAVARRLGSARLLEDVRGAYVHGMALLLVVCAVAAAAGLALTMVFLPRRAAGRAAPDGPAGGGEGAEAVHEAVT